MHSDDEQDGVERKCWFCGHGHVGSEDVIDEDNLGEESSSSTGSEIGDDEVKYVSHFRQGF